MSRATTKNVASVTTKDGKELTFDKPVSVWQALAQAEKAKCKP